MNQIASPKNKKFSRATSGTNEMQRKKSKKESSCINFNLEKLSKEKIPIKNLSSRINFNNYNNKNEPKKNDTKFDRKNNNSFSNSKNIDTINKLNYDNNNLKKPHLNNDSKNIIYDNIENYNTIKNNLECCNKENNYFNENKNNSKEEIKYGSETNSKYENKNNNKKYQSNTFTSNIKYQENKIPEHSRIEDYNNYGKNIYILGNNKIDNRNYPNNGKIINISNSLLTNNVDIRLEYVLKKLGLRQFFSTFDNNHISFIDFLFLTKDDLIEMSIPSYLIKKILDFIEHFSIVAKNYSINEISDFFGEY